ncbi:MAG: oxidoreductase, partial [Pseudomonadota bacterium]
MAQIIRHRAVVQDNWQLLEQDPAGALPFSGDVIVPLALWTSERDALSFRLGRVGIWLDTDADPAPIAQDLLRFEVIAIRFASFS